MVPASARVLPPGCPGARLTRLDAHFRLLGALSVAREPKLALPGLIPPGPHVLPSTGARSRLSGSTFSVAWEHDFALPRQRRQLPSMVSCLRHRLPGSTLVVAWKQSVWLPVIGYPGAPLDWLPGSSVCCFLFLRKFISWVVNSVPVARAARCECDFEDFRWIRHSVSLDRLPRSWIGLVAREPVSYTHLTLPTILLV